MILIKLRKKILSYAQMPAQEMGLIQAGDRKEKFARVCFKFCVVLTQNNLYGCRFDEHKQYRVYTAGSGVLQVVPLS